MALQLRPNCEYCDKDLPPDSTEAMICTYECTFCADCVDAHLSNVCPNCGGGFAPRPIRPAEDRRPGLGVDIDEAAVREAHKDRHRWRNPIFRTRDGSFAEW